MVTKIIMAFLKIITKIVSIILLPIDLLISNFLPDVNYALNSITQFMNLPADVMGWVFSVLHVPTSALSLLLAYWVYKYAVVGATSGVKKVITLYQRFKP